MIPFHISLVQKLEPVIGNLNFVKSRSLYIRSFLLNAKLNWKNPPIYVLLMGDADFDYRNITNLAYDFVNMIMNAKSKYIGIFLTLYQHIINILKKFV